MIATPLVAIPVIGAALCVLPLVSRRARLVAVAAGGAVAVLAAISPALPPVDEAPFWYAAPLGMRYAVDLDGLAAVFVALSGALFAVGAAASVRVPDRRAYFALWCLLLASVNGVFLARDLGLLFFCWEAMLVTAIVLIRQWGGRDRHASAGRLLSHALPTSALLLVVLVSLAVVRGTLDLGALSARSVAPSGQLLPALLSIAPFLVVVPLFPFHTWSTRLFATAPVPLTIVIAAVVAKAGVYGVVRVSAPLFPQGFALLAPVLIGLAAAGTLYGAVVAGRQRDTRRVLAFASLAYVNLILLSLFAATLTSVRGAVLASVSHGVLLASLLLLAGMLAARTRSFALRKGDGVAATAPALAGLATAGVLAWTGAPLTSGFAAEVSVLLGTYARYPVASAVAAISLAIAVVGGVRLLRRAYHGPPLVRTHDLGWRERLIVAPLLATSLVLGVAPPLVTDRVLPEHVPDAVLR